ncbi:MAG: cyclase, partial [Acidobacteriales bacterium]|nr:cyclase [Terriglobales bacterium]
MTYEQSNRRESSGEAQNGNYDAKRLGAIIAGGSLALFGLSRRSTSGIALALVGGTIAYMGSKSETQPQQFHARSAVQLNSSQEDVYRFWRDFQNLPLFTRHLESVTLLDDNRSRWTAIGPLGTKLTWDAEITSDRQNEAISWRSLPGSDIQVNGTVRFRQATGKRGTVVEADVDYLPPAGALSRTLAQLLGKDPSFLMEQDLRRFKALLETGEIPTTEGQSHAPRSVLTGA